MNHDQLCYKTDVVKGEICAGVWSEVCCVSWQKNILNHWVPVLGKVCPEMQNTFCLWLHPLFGKINDLLFCSGDSALSHGSCCLATWFLFPGLVSIKQWQDYYHFHDSLYFGSPNFWSNFFFSLRTMELNWVLEHAWHYLQNSNWFCISHIIISWLFFFFSSFSNNTWVWGYTFQAISGFFSFFKMLHLCILYPHLYTYFFCSWSNFILVSCTVSVSPGCFSLFFIFLLYINSNENNCKCWT